MLVREKHLQEGDPRPEALEPEKATQHLEAPKSSLGLQVIERGPGDRAEAGQSERIGFNFDTIRHTPNTLDSHRLIRFASAQGRQDEVVEALFAAYFLEGENIGDHEVLTRIAFTVGLDGHAVKDYLATDADRPEVAAEDLRARRMNIDAVPCFIVDGQYAISGAQEPEAFYPLLDLANFSRQAAE